MADNINNGDSYQELGRLVSGQCAAGFEQAVLRAELDVDFAEIEVQCVTAGGDSSRANLSAIDTADMHDRLDDIREEMARLSGQRWNTCTFTVFSDGRFKLDVQY